LLLLAGALVPLIGIITLSLFATARDRYVFMTLPMWLALGAVAVKEIFVQTRPRWRALALGVAILLLADPIAEDWLYFKYQHGNRWDWKGAFGVVQQRKAEGDLVATTWRELGKYYLGENVIWMLELDPLAVVESDKRIWFVDDGWINPGLSGWLQENGELIDVPAVNARIDGQMPGRIFEMRVYLYDPNRRTDSEAMR
jgi:hypothetical protein